MTTYPSLGRKLIVGFMTSLIVTLSIQADVTNIKDALGIALQQKAIEAGGDKMKLYSLSANYNGKTKRWSFQFYDGGANLHSITIDQSGKARHYPRDKGTMRIFDNVDFSKLPAPKEILIDDLVDQGVAALKALNFKPTDNGKLYLKYYVRSENLQKDKPYHSWSVTIPIDIAEGKKSENKQGKTVTFKNGKIDTVTNAIIYGG